MKRNQLIAWAVSFLAITYSAESASETMNGSQFLDLCGGKGEFSSLSPSRAELMCQDIAEGFREGAEVMLGTVLAAKGEKNIPPLFCAGNQSPEQLRGLLKRNLTAAATKSPTALSMTYGALLFEALMMTYRCPRTHTP